MKALVPYDSTAPLFVEARRLIRNDVSSLLEVGPGIRPQNFIRARRMVFAEPHVEYASVLKEAGFDVFAGDGLTALRHCGSVDTVVALDALEHMERAEGFEFLLRAVGVAEQVVIFTPLGFVEQSGGEESDAWGMQGQEWQRHRSGWTPEDFPGWKKVVDEAFHKRLGRGAFFAVWQR